MVWLHAKKCGDFCNLASFWGRFSLYLSIHSLVFWRQEAGEGAHDLVGAVFQVGAAVAGFDEAEGFSNGHADRVTRPAYQSAINAGIFRPGDRDRHNGNIRMQGKEF